jgi:hypothetical protein
MVNCDNFIRDVNAEWIEVLDNQCDVCVYKGGALGCK